jgi:hypothetical protein
MGYLRIFKDIFLGRNPRWAPVTGEGTSSSSLLIVH